MFICFGESWESLNAYGTGETIEQAIIKWSGMYTLSEAVTAFCEYKPKVVKGEMVSIQFNISASVIEP